MSDVTKLQALEIALAVGAVLEASRDVTQSFFEGMVFYRADPGFWDAVLPQLELQDDALVGAQQRADQGMAAIKALVEEDAQAP